MKLFTFSAPAFNDDRLADMPGCDWRGQPFKRGCLWYPFEEWRVKVHLWARNRTHAVKQIERALVPDVRDLDDGRRYPSLVPASIAKRFSK